MFGRKSVKSDTKSEHKSSGLENFTSFLKRNSTPEPIDDIPEVTIEKEFQPNLLKTPNSKSLALIEEVQQLDDKTIKPFLDYNEGLLFYPILSKIGETQDNSGYLDGLVDDGILEKQIYEKLIVCPVHSKTFSSSMRLYCPKCHSMNVEKLNLFEHKKCGYITESTNFDFSDNANTECPSCKKQIINFEKEIRVPAMWYRCDDCNEQFDNATIKLHCRKYEHDFDTNSGQFITTYCYKLKNSDMSLNYDTAQIKDEIITLLNGFNFETTINSSVKGKTGNVHEIPICAKSKTSDTSILIFIKNPPGGIDESTMNSILVPKLDIEPKNTLLITFSGITDSVEQLAKHYGIILISDPNFSNIISKVEEFVAGWYTKTGETK